MKIKEEKTYAHNIKHNKRTKIKIKEENNIYLWGKLIKIGKKITDSKR